MSVKPSHAPTDPTCMQVKIFPLRQALAVKPDEIKKLKKVSWHTYSVHIIIF